MHAALLGYGAMFRTPSVRWSALKCLSMLWMSCNTSAALLDTTAKHGPTRTGLQDMSNGPQHKL